MDVSASLEDYLESILILQRQSKEVRVKDIAEYMNIKPPSVTDAIKLLKNKKLVQQEKYGLIKLTNQGNQLSEKVFSKHKIIKIFLHKILGVDIKTAETDACKIEHCLNDKTIDRIKFFLNKKTS